MKKKPTGFVAICQCGVIVGAMDYGLTERKDAGQMLGKWLHEGCTVKPQFAGTWNVTVETCRCVPSNAKVEGTAEAANRPWQMDETRPASAGPTQTAR